MTKRIVHLLSLIIIHFSVQAQTPVDSLVNVLNTQELPANEKLELYMEICRAYMYSDIEKNKEYAEIGLKLAQKEKNLAMASKFTELIGISYFIKSSDDTATFYLEKALEMAIRSEDDIQQGSIYVTLGAYYGRSGQDDIALDYYLKAVTLCDNENGKYQYTAAINNLISTYSKIGKTEKAMEYAEKMRNMYEQENDLNGMLNAYSSLGTLHRQQKEYDKALEYELKTVEISRQVGNKAQECGTLFSIAEIYLYGYNDYDKALEYMEMSKRPVEEYGDTKIQTSMWKIFSQIYREQRNFEACHDASIKAWELDSVNMYSATTALNIVLSNIYLNDKSKAEDFLWKFRDLIYKLRDESIHESLANAEVKYETEKKEMRIATLEKEKQYYIWLGVAGIVLLLLAFGILFYRHRLNIQQRKNIEQQKELAEKQKILADQQRELAEQRINQLEKEKQLVATQSVLDGETAERSRLARDLHDGLGGMLSVVKLNLKEIGNYSALEKQDVNRFDKALKLLDQSVVELRRVAHHLMPDTLMRYGLRTSMEDFCNSIPNARFQYLGSNKRLDQRLEIVLYRCVHELVNNALKYAKATTIHVQLMIDNGLVSLTVQDDGTGFNPDHVASGSGLENIRTRVSAYNGNMTIHSSPEGGSEIIIEIENINS